VSRADATVSVVIPTFDREALVIRAIDSVVRQTCPPHEIIVVDDGSTDDTAARIRAERPGVRLIERTHRGVSAARNTGIRAATGDWIALLDSDDEWLPEKLRRQLDAVDEDAVLCHTDEIWIRRGRRVNPMKKHRKRGGRIFTHCLPLCAISPSSALVHRRVFETVGWFDEDLPACEDYDFWLRVTARFPVVFVDEPLVIKHGGHDDQLSRRYWGMDRFRITALEKILASDALGDADRAAAKSMLAEKIAIFAAGARKRGKLAEARAYESRIEP
jgi:glycosyltransferase involved in cell wall biosynthesis